VSKTTAVELPQATPYKQIALAFFCFILIGANDGALGVMLPSVQAHYQIDKATVGLLFFAISIGYLTLSFNNGLLMEKVGARLFLMLGALLYVLCAIAYSVMPSFPVLLLFAIGFGTAVAIFDAGLNAYVASLPRNTGLLNYLHAFYGAGAWLGPALASSLLALHWGWNNVYTIWGSMSLVTLVGFATLFNAKAVVPQQIERSGHEANADTTDTSLSTSKERNILLATLSLRVVWLAALMFLFYTGTEVSMGSWSFSFLTEARHGALLISGWIVSGYWLGLTLGRVVLGYVGQRIGPVRLIQYTLLGVIVGVLILWVAPVQAVSALGLFLTGFCLGPIFPTVIALMSTLVSARILPGAVGFLVSFANIGAALCSWGAGNLAQAIGLWTLLPYVLLLTLVMMVFWRSLQRNKMTG
jgi:fucose permease